MPIRVSGLNSGLDTDSIVQELVSAYRVKGDKLKKQQIKLSWTQDKWKALNTKVVKLYKSLDNLRFSSGYAMKKTTVSDLTKATVTASKNAANGSQSLKINQVAKSGYLTGAQFKNNTKGAGAKLSELGFNGNGKIKIEGGGVSKELQVDGNTTISSFIKQINESGTGVTASYDEANQRIFVMSKETGKANDFKLMGVDTDGGDALKALGLSAESSAASAEAAEWMKYASVDASGNVTVDTAKLKEHVDKLAQAKLDQDTASKIIEERTAANTKLYSAIGYLNAYGDKAEVDAALGVKDAQTMSELINMSAADRQKKYFVDDTGSLTEATAAQIADPSFPSPIKTGDDWYNELKTNYNIQETQDKIGEDGNPVLDDSGNPVQEENELYKQIREYQQNKSLVTAYEQDSTNSAYKLPAGASSADAQAKAQDYVKEINDNDVLIKTNQEKMAQAAETLEQYKLLDSAAITKEMVDPSVAGYNDVIKDLTDRVTYFAQNYEKVSTGEYQLKGSNLSAGATRVNGEDAEITLNGATFTSSSNTFNINGLTIQAHAVTTEDIMITTATDTQGLYDKIKDFLTEYNAIISEMSSLYNADSSKGYEPLTSEEKEAMSDSEIADWEKKIKDSLLRRDMNLNGLITTMTNAMSSTVEIGGKKYSLASLGIKTESYFNTTAATRYMYHIDGDPDDDTSSTKEDKLMAMLNSDPDTAIEIIKGVTSKLYEGLEKKMRPTTMRSYQTIYNDKQMAINYSDYTKKISAWEEKVSKIEESYYKKFAAMETALSKLQSQQSSLAGLLG